MGEADPYDEDRTFYGQAKSYILAPLRILTSKEARIAYLRTILISLTLSILLAISITSYILFYYAFIPERGFSRPVHLQFHPHHEHHPYGYADIQGAVASEMPYDVRVIMALPRTPRNVEMGNWMIDVKMLGPVDPSGATEKSNDGKIVVTDVDGMLQSREVLAHTRRPAIMTYRSTAVEHAHKAVALPWYMLGWASEAETLDVGMFEDVEFSKGWKNAPANVMVELISPEKLHIYRVDVVFTAHFTGLRYLMYRHRILSFLFFTFAFFSVELVFAVTAYLVLTIFVFPSSAGDEMPPSLPKREATDEGSAATIKAEEDESALLDDLSETERTFPTYSRQPPLRFTSPKPKKEEDEDSLLSPLMAPPVHGEADDEDEEADFVVDSGLGTSLESGLERNSSSRRRKGGLLRTSSGRDIL